MLKKIGKYNVKSIDKFFYDGWHYCLNNALDEFERSEGYDD